MVRAAGSSSLCIQSVGSYPSAFLVPGTVRVLVPGGRPPAASQISAASLLLHSLFPPLWPPTSSVSWKPPWSQAQAHSHCSIISPPQRFWKVAFPQAQIMGLTGRECGSLAPVLSLHSRAQAWAAPVTLSSGYLLPGAKLPTGTVPLLLASSPAGSAKFSQTFGKGASVPFLCSLPELSRGWELQGEAPGGF